MNDQVVFDPPAMDGYARASADAVGELGRTIERWEDALDQVAATAGDEWRRPSWTRRADLDHPRTGQARLGALAGWLADRARALDADGLACAALDLDRLGPLPAHVLLGPGEREVWAARLAADLKGRHDVPFDEADWTRFRLLAGDPAFAGMLVYALGGAVAVVDALLAQHDLLAPGDGPSAGGLPDGEIDGVGASPELARVARVLGTAFGAVTLDPSWTGTDTEGLARILRAGQGERGFAPRRAEGLAVLVAAAERVRPAVLVRLLDTAIEVERAGTVARPWAERATGPATEADPWPRPLVDHQGHVADDVVSTLLLALGRMPEAGLVALAGGPRLTRPGDDRPVDATLAHLLLDHEFDPAGWDRLGTTLERAVVTHRGRDGNGLAAARLSAQSIALAAERAHGVGKLPPGFQPGITTVLADAMPAAVPALAGTDPSGWIAESPDRWTYVDAGIHAPGEPIQPAVFQADAETIVHRLGSNLPAVEALIGAAIATMDVGVRHSLEGAVPEPLRLRRSTNRSARATGRILTVAHDGVSADHADAERRRGRVSGVGTWFGLATSGAAQAFGTATELLGDTIIHEPAVPADYDGLDAVYADQVERAVLDRALVHGLFDDVPDEVVRRDASGVVVGFRHDGAAFADWAEAHGSTPVIAAMEARTAFGATADVHGPG